MYRVMFVCTGNICRSPLAHAVFSQKARKAGKGDQFMIESSGTTAYHEGDQADPRMRKTARVHNVRIDHRARHFSVHDFDNYDLILAMDTANLASLRRIAPNGEADAKVKLFRDFDPEGSPNAEVPDPYYGGGDGFEKVFAIVDRTCDSLLVELAASQ